MFTVTLRLQISAKAGTKDNMTDWIDELTQQRDRTQKSQEWQAHYAQVFPALAERFWEHLLVLLERDIQKLNQEVLDAQSVITIERPVAGHIAFRKLTYPAHHIVVS